MSLPSSQRLLGTTLMLCLMATLISCGNAAETDNLTTTNKSQARVQQAKESLNKMISFTGKVIRLEFEGGFWGIETDDGQKLRPDKLPIDMQQDGLLVTGKARLQEGGMGIQMWGTPAQIISLEKTGE